MHFEPIFHTQTDCEVDFAPPLDYVEPVPQSKPAPAAPPALRAAPKVAAEGAYQLSIGQLPWLVCCCFCTLMLATRVCCVP